MPFAVLALCAGLAVFWGLAGLCYIWGVNRKTHSVWRAGIFAGVFFIAEFARGHVFGGFPWNLPGYIFPAGKPISQLASITGIYGLTAFVFMLSGALALLIAPRQGPNNKRIWVPFLAAITCLTLIFGYGMVRLGGAQVQYVDGVNLRLVHANIPQRDKFDGAKYVQNANTYLRLSRSTGFEDVTHIIWPEGAIPGEILKDQGLMEAINELFRSRRGPAPVFITQTLRSEQPAQNTKPQYFNAATAISFPQGRPATMTPFYDKQKLVPFGEFIPGGDLVEALGLESLSSALESMTPGKSGDVPLLPGLPPASLQICYEIIFPGFTTRTPPMSGERPQWILNLSNDAWYGNSTGPRQHINQARYRAIEQGIPVVRATSGGISGVIDSYGRQVSHLGLGQEGALDTKLPTAIGAQLYKISINYIILLIIVFLLIGCILCTRRL